MQSAELSHVGVGTNMSESNTSQNSCHRTSSMSNDPTTLAHIDPLQDCISDNVPLNFNT